MKKLVQRCKCGIVAIGLKEIREKFSKGNSDTQGFQSWCKVCTNLYHQQLRDIKQEEAKYNKAILFTLRTGFRSVYDQIISQVNETIKIQAS